MIRAGDQTYALAAIRRGLVASARLVFVCGFLLLLALVGIAWFSGLADRAAPHGANQFILKRLEVSDPVRQVVVGRDLLGQNVGRNSAADMHIRLVKSDASWLISNVATARKLFLRFGDGVGHNAGLAFLRTGDEVVVGEQGDQTVFVVTAVSHREMTLVVQDQSGSRRFTLAANGRLRSMNHANKEVKDLTLCREPPGLLERGYRALRQAAAGDDTRVLVRAGGARSCYDWRYSLLSVVGRGFDSLRIVFVPGRGFAVEQGQYPFVNFRRGERVFPVRQTPHLLVFGEGEDKVQLSELIAGRTRYKVVTDFQDETTKASLALIPIGGQHRLLGCESAFVMKGLRKVCAGAPDTAKNWKTDFGNGPTWSLLLGILLPGSVIGVVLVFLWLQIVRWHAGTSGFVEYFQFFFVLQFAGLAVVAAISHFVREPDTVSLGARHPFFAVSAFLLGAAAAVSTDRMSGLARAVLVIVVAIVAAGNVNLADIGFASAELRFMRFFNESLHGLALAGVVLAGFAMVPAIYIARFVKFSGQTPGLILIAVWSVLWMGTWGLFGVETGVANLFQPSEILKSTLLFALSIMVARAFLSDLQSRHRRVSHIWWILAAIVVTLGLFFVAPVVRSDHSPLVVLSLTIVISLVLIVGVHFAVIAAEWLGQRFRLRLPPLRIGGAQVRRSGWALLFWWPWRRIKRVVVGAWRGFWSRPVELFVPTFLVLMIAVGWSQVPEDRVVIERWLDDQVGGFLSTPARRVRSNLELDLDRTRPDGSPPVIEFPDIGRQVLLSRRLIAGEPCRYVNGPEFLVDVMPGWLTVTLGQQVSMASGQVYDWMRPLCSIAQPELNRSRADKVLMPAIHNDFASTWLFVTFGRDGAVGVLVLQIVAVVLMIVIVIGASRWRRGAEQHRFEVTILLALVSGFAVLLGVHWAISWANAFGVVPVMGQPSTFISAGRSHFLFVGLASVVALLALARVSRLGETHSKYRVPMVPYKFSGFEYGFGRVLGKLTLR